MTVGPFTLKNKKVVKLIGEIMICFQFEEDIFCQYDPLGIIQEKRKKLKRGVYEHKGTKEMSKLTNKLAFSDGDESDFEDTEISKILALVTVQEKGKMPLDQEGISPASEKKRVKRIKVSKQLAFQVQEHSSPNIMIIKGEVTTIQSIIDHYLELNIQTKTNDQGKLNSYVAPHLVSSLDKEK